ncbi:hypothetical protein EC991_003191 [Linnemannia zychae]|nr:hypothetical protein EC991_003191 [Linnemannia zychae]
MATDPVTIVSVIAISIVIMSCIGMCIRPKHDPNAIHHCPGCRCKDTDNNNVTLIPVYPQPPQPTYVTAAAAPSSGSTGVRIEAAPPVTIIDMSSASPPVYPAAGFSNHPKPTIITSCASDSKSTE